MSGTDQYNLKDGNWLLNVKGPKKPLKELWRLDKFEAKIAPIIYDGLLYIYRTDKYKVYGSYQALDPENGKTVWEHKKIHWVTEPVFFENRVIFGAKIPKIELGGHVFSLDQKTGEEIWKYQIEEGVHELASRPLVHEDSLLCLAGKALFALDINDGKKKWSLGLKGDVSHNPCVYAENKIFVSTHVKKSGFLHCIDSEKQKENWKIKTEQWISDFLYIDGFLYFAAGSGYLFIVDVDSGMSKSIRVVELKEDQYVSSPSLVHDDGILVTVYGYSIAALDLHNGQLLWYKHIAGEIGKPVISDSVLYFGTMWKGIFGLDLRTGTELFHEETEVRSDFVCGLSENRLFYASSMTEDLLIAYEGTVE